MSKKYPGDVIAEVRQTNQYDAFKHLKGNRSVSLSRVARIKASIEAVGFRMNPIVVNKNLEVIDGQGRLATLRMLGKPVFYVVDESAGVEECKWLNLGQENWKSVDWVIHYSELGSDDYARLLEIWNEYKDKGFSLDVIAGMFCGTQRSTRILKEGLFKAKVSKIEVAGRLDLLSRVVSIKNNIVGDPQYLFYAIDFANQLPTVNKDRLVDCVLSRITQNTQISDMNNALNAVEKAYNFHIKGEDHVYIRNEYERAMREKYSWYANKYGIQ